MSKRTWSGLAAVIMMAVASPPTATAVDANVGLQRDVGAVHAAGVTGVAAAITVGGRAVQARAGVGDVRSGRPVPFEGRFRAGSVTKTFVSVVLLQLVGEGRLTLEDTVDQWLPGVVSANGNDGRKITIRRLLQHTSGLSDYLGPGVAPSTVAEFDERRFDTHRPRDLVAKAITRPPKFPPGRGWAYSNTNYVLAGMVIHSITGRTWATEVRDRLVRRLSLTGTSVPGTSPLLLGPHSRGYEHHPDGSHFDVTIVNPSLFDAAGALITTANDLNRFAAALAGGRLLRQAQQAELVRLDPHSGGYALGIGILTASCGIEYLSHNGVVYGYYTLFGVTTDGERSVTVSATTLGLLPSLWNPEPALRAVSRLVDNAICARR
ncbi:hypothetical protein BS329_35385 [Amycolatopsis coloradensis]|uniref:Beta-lactamase-related domain-containing protein n=2 Tax=Amycolatopsis coloradensis TaxID=76021 RepID=A0A1R0KH79_9PSEU|nr:hypothetical protein BS329_35385 [Amycolatopsis coloradensis]